MAWNLLWILAVVAAVLCAVGFYKYVYFLSIGYGFAIAGLSVTMLIMFAGKINAACIVLLILFILYGARLSGFLLYREIKNKSYRKTLDAAMKPEEKMNFGIKISIWLSVTVLYVAQVSPVFYRILNKADDMALPLIGAVISVIGLIIESLADIEKTEQKKENPSMVATKKLYKLVRCPNYFGEVLFWTGIFVSGLTALSFFGQWILAIVSYISIVYIMLNGAKRLEKRQNKRYGELAEYKAYRDKTPIIIPFIPLYHLNKN